MPYAFLYSSEPGNLTSPDSVSVPGIGPELASASSALSIVAASIVIVQEADMAKVPSAVIAAGGLVGGYGVARWTKKRQLGGAVLAVAGAAAAQQWRERAGGKAAGALTAAYVAAFAGSHPLARKVGAWPAVFGVAGAVALASWAVADRNA
jgi:hypothetical protein